jgi:protein-glutamine gamma-glutamyltransferase
MRFSAIHKVASYLMVSSAFAALALSRELSPLVVALTIAAVFSSFFVEPPQHAWLRGRVWTGVWNGATLVAFSWTILDALRGEALFSGVRFLCFLLVNKLFNRRASRDYLQAYVVSFLMLVAGAALSSDLAYAACFLGYVVFATWTLTLFHLRREMEENYLLKHSDGALSERVEVDRILNSRRIVGGSFLAGTSLVSLGIFLGATAVFFLIPRFGFGFFVSRARHGTTTVGFSDRVDLNDVGSVKDNPQVVVRVGLDAPPAEPLRLRGISLDRYQHGRWSRTAEVRAQPLKRWDALWLVDKPSAARVRDILAHARRQVVYLDPLDTAVVFGASQPVAFELDQARAGLGPPPIELEARGGGEVVAVERHVDASGRTYAGDRKSGLRYTVWSEEPRRPIGELLSLPDGPRPNAPELAPYLQLPGDLPPRVAELARTITAHARGPYAKALAVEKYLRETYRYTLDLKRDERYEPIDDFLFVTRAGHCEYFATAMAILLRALGIPTRSVNGFLGGEWNDYGKYVAVRQGNAHSWVEVFIDGGWLTFDPTPGGSAAAGGVWNKLAQMTDWMEFAWFKYVIELDLNKQANAVSSIRKWLQNLTSTSTIGDALKRHDGWLGGLGALLAGAIGLRAWRRRRPSARLPRAGAQAQGAFQRALKALERRGHARGTAETGRELAVRVARAGDPAAQQFSSLVELYYAARFGGDAVPPAELDRLAQQVQRPPSPSV